MAKITYTDKSKSGVTPVNKWRDVDANEVKASVNAIYDLLSCGVYAALTGESTTTVSDTAEYYPINGFFSNDPLIGFEFIDDPAIKYTGTKTSYFKIHINASLMCKINATTVYIGVKKNGELDNNSVMEIFCKTHDEVYNVNTTLVASLSTNDKIQLVVSTDQTDDITFKNLTTTIAPFIMPLT